MYSIFAQSPTKKAWDDKRVEQLLKIGPKAKEMRQSGRHMSKTT
jgi:hypothetical protein